MKNEEELVTCFYCKGIYPKKETWGLKKIRACKDCAKKAQKSPYEAVQELMMGKKKEQEPITEEKILETGAKIKGNKRKLRKMKKIAKMMGFNKEELAEAQREMGIIDDNEVKVKW